jgi:Fe-S cluster assembly protein SufD
MSVLSIQAPSGREEAWRFTPLERLRGLQDRSAGSAGEIGLTLDVAPEFSVESLSSLDDRVLPQSSTEDFVVHTVREECEVVTYLRLAPNELASRPSTLLIEGKGNDRVSYGRSVVELGHHAEATLVIRHSGEATYADEIEFRLGDGARLTVISVQEWSSQSVHVGRHHAILGKDAHFKSVIVTLGGDVVRLSPSVEYAAPGGNAEMYGLYFADADQHLEHRLLVDHSVPRCRSRVTYKGALQGQGARSVWIGDVMIRPEAEGTDTYELNRNLILSEGAHADSVPNLEIQTGEIEGAGHASATGRFDDEQLFYLQARGIPAHVARRLVVRGFFAELIAQINIPELQEHLMDAIERELAQVDA